MEFTRFYQQMRPRLTNPTYNSSHVSSSLGMMLSSSSGHTNTPNLQHSKVSSIREVRPNPSQNHGKDYASVQNGIQVDNSKQGTTPHHEKQTRTQSLTKLSSYGTHSLTSLPKQISDRDIYEKQAKRYNIISIKPVQHAETIRKYPKFHLENIDNNFYKKMQLESEYAVRRKPIQHPQSTGILTYNNTKIAPSNPQAGNVSPKKQGQQSGQQNTFHHKNSGELDFIPNSLDRQDRTNQEKSQQRMNFRGKMLNNVDQLTGML